MINKWKINRAGLFNFWYYDEEIFPFADGKLLLRGSNGSGKSVTMQSFLPVLLDGKTSPDRLDPFGSKARKMEDYLLGEKEIVNRDERTGYLFMEFKRQNTDQYITIGIGLQAKRNKKMKFWGFVITDNRRIGETFKLYKMENNAAEKLKIPLSRVELENAIGEDGGHVVQTKTEYMNLVNKYLFGFETIEAYHDLIKLLIQLRSPKLSKDFKPTVIYEILEEALPPLSDDDLRHLSDTIEQMDQTKQQIEQLDREATAITSLNQVYRTYNERHLADLANEMLETGKRLKREEQEHEVLATEWEKLHDDIALLEQENRALLLEKETNQDQERRLRSHKVWDLQAELTEKREQQDKESQLLTNKRTKAEDYRKKESKLLLIKNELEEKISNLEAAFADRLIDMENDAEEISFTEAHQLNRQDFNRHIHDAFDFAVWSEETARHGVQLEKVKEDMQQFEAVRKEYQDKDKQLAEEEKSRDEASVQEQDWLQLFEEDKEKKLNEIHHWVQENSWMHVQEEELQSSSRKLFSLYETVDYENLKEPFKVKMQEYESSQLAKLSELKFQMQQKELEISEKEEELTAWKHKKDPEPELHPLTGEARNELKQKNIAHVPFYAAVEFQKDISPEIQRGLEAALLDSGMLDALITDEAFAVKHDRILLSNPQMMAHTLADYLKPDLDADISVPEQRVAEILQSILIADDPEADFSIQENGQYQLGLLKGHAIPVEEVRYIGRNARKRFRLEQIARMEQELAALNVEKQDLSMTVREADMELSDAKARFSAFPSDADLKESYKQIQNIRWEIERYNKQIARLSDELKRIHTAYTESKRLVDEQTRNFNIESTLAAYQEAISITRRYASDLSRLEKGYIQYTNDQSKQQDTIDRLEELEEDSLEIQGEIIVSEDLVSSLEKNIEQIETQLKQEGLGDISKKISNVQHTLIQIEKRLDHIKDIKPRKESDRDYKKETMETKIEHIHFWQNLKNAWKSSFEQEMSRGLVFSEQDKSADEQATTVVHAYGHLLKEKEKAKLTEQLTKEYYKQISDLMEYRPNSYDVPLHLSEWMQDLNEDSIPFIDQWKQKTSRQIIELHYDGKQVTPDSVQQRVEWEQARQESFLDDQDRALYEEILFNSVGQKLRARIRRAEQWVQKMKMLMESRDTSSGLSFSIRWKPRTADADTEMDTADLVDLLRQDPTLLKEEDLDRITTHFRTKISRAKELMDDGSEMQTLLQVLKEVLDYRKWFSFVLYFQRENENRRELTNNQFYKFSGGEKAMAMYIPLFTACYSRYSEAAEDAPYIISLDEAFAGVDENNIREMFEIVEQLGFNYIMNSQVLWGDYDTISQLAISELLRPKNADFVSVIRYHWDGKKRSEVTLEESEEIIGTLV